MITKSVTLKSDELKIVGQLFLPGKGRYPAVCICHGIPSGLPPAPGDKGYPGLAEEICRVGLAVFIFNFRGTGASEGNLDILGWTKDLQVAIDYLSTLPEVNSSHLALLGFSGGAAVSVYVASGDKRVSSVVVCACPARFDFAAWSDDAAELVEYFRHIGCIRDDDFPQDVEQWRNGFEIVKPIDYVDSIAPRPLLLVHGSQDELVDISHAYELYERAGEPKMLKILDGGGHRLRQDKQVVTIITDWLKSRLLQ